MTSERASKIRCSDCGTVIEFADSAPNFCSHCGTRFASSNKNSAASTIGETNARPDSRDYLTRTFDAPLADSSGGRIAPSRIPEQVAGYRMLQELGKGGMGVVHEAEQQGTGRRVAVKLLMQRGYHSEEAVERFLQEGRVAASLSHPKSTFVYSAGRDGDLFYIAMELMPGGTLKDQVEEQGMLPLNKAVDYVLDLIDGLEPAHTRGIVHRDIKPSNCFLDRDGGVKIGDYGLSKSLVDDAALTRTGVFMGTPQFAAPEQVRSGYIDQRTDLYAIGATLFYLLAGRAPFEGDVSRVIADIASEPAPRLASLVSDLPADVGKLVDRTLEKDPSLRPDSLNDVRRVLAPYASGRSSIADVGRRLAAHFIDTTAIGFATAVFIIIAIMIMLAAGLPFPTNENDYGVGGALASFLVFLIYYGIFEGVFGAAIGKRLMGLRVVSNNGGTPGVLAAVIRTSLVPGLSVIAIFLLGYSSAMAADGAQDSTQFSSYIWPQVQRLAGILLVSLCFVTMTRRNGYRGVHELLSRTRVRRNMPTTDKQFAAIPVTHPIPLTQESIDDGVQDYSAEGYAVNGLISESPADGLKIFHAADEDLQRSVWIVQRDGDASALTLERTSVIRPTRLHWLSGGTIEDPDSQNVRWDAFQAIHGSPIREVVRDSVSWPWQRLRYRLADLADELTLAQEDGTLPDSLGANQVWIDQTGHVKLLDFPIVLQHLAGETTIEQQSSEDVQGQAAAQLFAEIVSICEHVRDSEQSRDLPEFAIEFIAELRQRPLDTETLQWAAEELREQPDKLGTLTWDERLGALAVSAGIESAVISMVAFFVGGTLSYFTNMNHYAIWIIVVALCLAIPIWSTIYTRGGVAFRLAGISVRSRGEPATTFQLVIRSIVAWLPGIVAFGSVCILNVPRFLNLLEEYEGIPVLILALFALIGFGIHFFGALFAIVSSQRGLQDYIAGTFLVPK